MKDHSIELNASSSSNIQWHSAAGLGLGLGLGLTDRRVYMTISQLC